MRLDRTRLITSLRAALVAGCAFAFALSVAVPAAHAQEIERPNDPGFIYYEKAAAKILKSAGNKCWEAAEKAKRSGFHQHAYEQAKRAIRFDPNQEDAREHLGYVKRQKEWVLDEEEAGKVRKQNTRGGSNGKQESVESFEARRKKWHEEILAKADEYVAKKYAQLGADCAKKGFPLQATKAYEYSLRLDEDNKAARKGLGYKKFGKVWLTAKQDKARKDAAESTEVKEESERDRLFGTTLNKVESAHFRIESPLPIGELQEINHVVEQAYAYYLADLGYDPTRDVFGRRAVLVFMEDGDQWNKFVDATGGSDFTRKMGGTGSHVNLLFGHRMKEGGGPLLRKDSAIHDAIHMLNAKFLNLRGGAWIDEGLAYYYTVKVLESCRTHCVSLKKGNYANPGDEGGIKDWNDANNWKPNVREMVDKSADVELRALVVKPITTLEFEATIKAWSVISWMMDEDRDTFIDLAQRLGNVKNHVEALESTFEKQLEAIDKEWREYVLRNY